MYPVWIFQLITTIANWSLQVALSSHEATREHRSVPLQEPGTICNEDNSLLKMFAIEEKVVSHVKILLGIR